MLCLGHSLGAGVAVLIALQLLEDKSRHNIPEDTSIECFAFAPPPVFRLDEGSISDEIKHRITIIINNQDCIPRTSLGKLKQLL